MRSRVNSLIGAALLATLLSSCGVRKALHHMPDLSGYNDSIPQVQLLDSAGDVRRCGTGTLLRNDHGLWELRLQGDPLELGLYQGALEGDLYRHQENIFFDKIKDLVPKPGKQRLLIKFLGWFNRNMYKHVTNEYLAEIEGLSRYDGHTYDHVAPAYMRALYLHGAHDIGHAVQQMALVECSSFAAWGESSCCLLYTSDAADERSSVDLGGRRIIKKKNKKENKKKKNNKQKKKQTTDELHSVWCIVTSIYAWKGVTVHCVCNHQ